MTYTESIRAVIVAEAAYQLACERGDLVEGPLTTFNAAKAAHRAAFGTLTKVNGVWA